MAERGAHLTSTVYPKPSLFEVVAQDSLNATIHPALQKIAMFLLSNNPKKYEWLANYCDEVYLIINGLLQYSYVWEHDASFSEHFYSLKRVINSTNGPILLDKRKLSLFFLVIMPYLKIKLENKINIYRLQLADGVLLNNWKTKIKEKLCQSYACFHFCWNICTIAQYLTYMSGKTDVQSPVLRILKLKLIYSEPENNTAFWTSLIKGNLSFSKLSFGLIGQGLTSALEIGAFFIRFLQYWQNEHSGGKMISLPMPEPPLPDPKALDYQGKCPICYQKWKVATVVPVSGYIYCFRCIIKHLQKTASCPVTKLPVNIADLVRLYPD